MTRKDFELIASVLSECESRISMFPDRDKVGGTLMVEMVTEELAKELKRSHPRFNHGRFMSYSLPIKYAGIKAAISEKLKV